MARIHPIQGPPCQARKTGDVNDLEWFITVSKFPGINAGHTPAMFTSMSLVNHSREAALEFGCINVRKATRRILPAATRPYKKSLSLLFNNLEDNFDPGVLPTTSCFRGGVLKRSIVRH